jgi:hypothetical protein
MKNEYGADRRIAFAGHMTLVGYYAQCQPISVPFYGPAASVALWLTNTNPDLLIIHRKELPPGAPQLLVDEASRLGWQTVSGERLPANCRTPEYVVLARSQLNIARQPGGDYASGLQ